MASLAQNATYRFGSFVLDLQRGALLTAGGEEMRLRPKSYELLQLLVENAGRLLAREAIMERLWPNIYVTEENITQCIHDIRSALGANSHRILRTVPRRGYLFAAEVTIVLPPRPSPGDHAAVGQGGDSSTSQSEPIQSQPEPWDAEHNEVRSQSATPHPGIPQPLRTRLSVVLAPLRNLGVPKAHEYLVESIPEDISTELTMNLGTLAIAAPEAMHRAGDPDGPRAIAGELGANYLIHGSIRGIADRLAVNLHLTDVESRVQLWSEGFDLDLGTATDTRNDMTTRAASTLFRKLIEEVNRRVEVLPRQDWTADDLVMRGLALFYRPVTAQIDPDPHRQEALRCFEQALAMAPESNLARIGIVCVLLMDIAVGDRPSGGPDEVRAERLLAEVLRVNGQSVSAHLLMGILRRGQFRLNESLIELKLTLGLVPNHSHTLANLGFTLVLLGQPDAAIPLIERSLRLTPHDFYAPISHSFLGLGHLLLGNAEDAIACLRTAQAMNPRMYFVYSWLAGALGLAGQVDQAAAALRKAIEMRPEFPQTLIPVKHANPGFVVLFERTVYAGLRRAGLPDVWAD